MRKVADVEILALCLVQAEHLQRIPGVTGVDGLHIGVFFKDLLQLFLADVSNLSPKGDRNLAFCGRQGDIALLHELGIEGLALGCEKMDALFIHEHHVNDPGLRMAVCANGGYGGGVDVLYQELQIIIVCHVFDLSAQGGNFVDQLLFLELVGRVAGEVGDHAVGVVQVEHLKDGVGSGLILALHDGVADAHFLGSHVVLEDGLAVEPNPGVGGAGNGDLNLGVLLHILVDVLLVVGAEPQLAVQFACEHEGAALCLAVTTDGSQILHRVGIQKFYDFVHDKYLQKLVVFS